MENKEKIIDFYENATQDYAFWSKDYNMHFGLATLNVFNREKMLRKMNSMILETIEIQGDRNYLDIGCGCGATVRQGSFKYKKSNFFGITLSKWQIQKCNELMKEKSIENAEIIEGDFTNMPYKNESMDGAWALESLCHCKKRLEALQEISRVLKKGKTIVIADGFVKINPKNSGYFFQKFYKILCEGWSLPNLANIYDFTAQLGEAGFKIKEVKDLSWHIAPSVIHSPFVILKFLISNLLKRKPLKNQSIQNLKASFISFFMGIQRSKFSYYRIVAEKI